MIGKLQPFLLNNRKRSLIALRGVMTLAIAAVAMPNLPSEPGPGLTVLAVYAATNIVLFFEKPAAFVRRAPAMLLFVFDLAAVTLLMFLSGETQTQFYLCFFLIILMAALTHSARSAVIIAALSAGAYAVLAGVRSPEDLLDLAFTTRAALFFVTALFAGYLAEETDGERKLSRRLAEKIDDETKAHRRSEERFRRFAENLREVLWLTDATGERVEYVSPGYATIWGRSCEGLQAAPGSWVEAVHPDDRARVLEAARIGLATGAFNEEYRLVRPDGTARWVRDRSFPMLDERGEVYRVARIAEDVTEVRRLGQDRESLHELSRALNGPLLPRDAGRRIAAACRRVLHHDAFVLSRLAPSRPELETIYAEGTLEGGAGPQETPTEPPASSPRAEALALLRKPILAQDPGDPEAAPFLPRPGPGPPPRSGMIVPIVWESKVFGFLACWSHKPGRYTEADLKILGTVANLSGGVLARLHVMDLLRNREEDLRQAQKMEAVGRLAGGVAHDFNNLLTAITGYAELLAKQASASGATVAYADEILAASQRAASLTGQLLAFSRRQVLQPSPLDLNGVVRGVAAMLQRLIGEDIELVTRLDPVPAPIVADKGRIEQVIMNLAVNARDAMPCGGKLTLATTNEAGGVVLEVSDTGVGMDAPTLSHLFEPYFTTKKEGKGTGLGLATVHGIVSQSAGVIQVHSEPDRGSRFLIRFPRAVDPVGPSPQPSPRPHPRGGSETILMVEDSDIVRKLAREVLLSQGYVLLEARNGVEAARIAERKERVIHLLLTDVVMPEMNGPELATQLRPLRPDMKVLFMSGYPEEAVSNTGILTSGADFLPKPFTPLVLMKKVREILDQPPPASPDPPP